LPRSLYELAVVAWQINPYPEENRLDAVECQSINELHRSDIGHQSIRPERRGIMPTGFRQERTCRPHRWRTCPTRNPHAGRSSVQSYCTAFGVPASNLALAGSVDVVPVDGSTHGHGFEPKKAGALVRYKELGMVCGVPLPAPEAPSGVAYHTSAPVTQSQLPWRCWVTGNALLIAASHSRASNEACRV
jgi:hypothetical protein